ncbi:MAG: fused MFS/spermidine synthase [Verrucomicrobiota bacterium]|nr:fused MFS/spermidine synthase [Verrucomicrobiota bacterium]
MRPPPLKHASEYGVITLRFRKRSRTLTYAQKGGNQSTSDCNGVSLDAHIHALYGLALQRRGRKVLMIGCGGGTLGSMLARANRQVSIVEIDPVSFALSQRYFGLPRNVACHVGDGLAFLQKTRRRYDVVIIDAFTGENIPDHLKGAAFFEAVVRCLRKDGVALVNVCLDRKSDPTADRIAAGFKEQGRKVRVLDSPGGERNAIVLAGDVGNLRRPKLLIPPRAGAKITGKELRAMHFRRRR